MTVTALGAPAGSEWATGTNGECEGCPVLENPLFLSLPKELRERALCLFRPAELASGMPLYIEGFPAHSVFAVRSGTCKAVRATSGGREQVLRAYRPGEFIGFDALPLERYPCTVQATTRAVICHAPRNVFVDMVVDEPDFAREVIRHLCDELRSVRDDLASLGTLGALARVARLLLEQGRLERGGDRTGVSLPLNRRDTAGLLGMAEESLSRQLTLLERMGVVRRKGRRLVIEDQAQLEQLAEG
jgi:CRP/FNR family transcriptional regulator, anaerobic regulatory protein